MTEPSASIKTSTILIASTGVIVSGIIAYAAYFDYKRRSDPEFRRALKKESRREAKAAKAAEQAHGQAQEKALQDIVDEVRGQDFQGSFEEKETYFMQEVSKGESLLQQDNELEAASSFYKALRVYPSPPDLINIYEKTVTKPVIDLLAKIISKDPELRSRLGAGGGNPLFDVDVDN